MCVSEFDVNPIVAKHQEYLSLAMTHKWCSNHNGHTKVTPNTIANAQACQITRKQF